MFSKQKHYLLSFVFVLLLSFVSNTLALPNIALAADPYTAASNGGSCKSGDTAYDDTTTTPGVTTKMCRPADAAQADPTNGGAASSDNETTCAIEKMGWILCPIIETSGKVSDQAFQYLSKTFLETEPELVSNSNAGTKQAWELARNLANIMFIIAFLVIIYSQVTGAGITNYGIKKMLPRLIVAAIAVNASYYICQILVDLTNIMGYEIQKFLVDTARSITSNAVMPIASDGPSLSQDSGTLSQIAIGVLAVGAIVYFLLPVLGSVVLFVLITCLSIIIILLLRKTFIVLLIVAAPVAFVLYLLPNTEKYFQKWLSMFWKLLLVFPVVGILMGGGQLASSIILVAGTQSTNYKDTGEKCITLPQYSGSTQSQANAWSWLGGGQQSNQATVTGGAAIGTCTAGSVPFMLGLTAAGIAVLPLLAVWSVLKGALAATGAIGGKLGATINGMNSGAKGKMQKARQELGEDRRDRKALRAVQNPGSILGAGARRRAFRSARRASVKQQLGRATEDAVYDRAYNSETGELTAYGQRMAGAGLLGKNADETAKARVVRSMQGVEQKNEQEETTAIQYQNRDKNTGELQAMFDKAVAEGDRVMMRAMAEALSKHGAAGANSIAAVVGRYNGSQELRSVINNHTDMKSSRADVAAWATDSGNRGLSYHQGQSTTYSKLSDAQLASQTTESFQHAEAAGVLDNKVTVMASDGTAKQVSRATALASVKEMSGDNKVIAARH